MQIAGLKVAVALSEVGLVDVGVVLLLDVPLHAFPLATIGLGFVPEVPRLLAY